MAKREKLIVAVSGGVDSMVMLDRLVKESPAKLVVAHVNHGIRTDAGRDEELVSAKAREYGLEYVSTRLKLGENASEAEAREGRYAFLNKIGRDKKADGIVAAHHQDDVVETMMINILRGTGWRGLSSLRSHAWLRRPLIGLSKAEIAQYAIDHDLQWHEDSTNNSLRYFRNKLRHHIIPHLTLEQRNTWLRLWSQQTVLATQIEKELRRLLPLAKTEAGLSRYFLIMVPQSVGMEIIQEYIGLRLQRADAMRLLIFARGATPGKKAPVSPGAMARVTLEDLIVYPSET